MLPNPKEVFQDHFTRLETELNDFGIPTHRQSVRDFIAGKAFEAMGDTFADYADELLQRAKDARL